MPKQRVYSLALILVLLASAALAQEPNQKPGTVPLSSFSQLGKQKVVNPSLASNPVAGSGTTGYLSRWAGVDGSNTYTLGDSTIFVDKFGKVGIGTITPTSLFTVQGMIETTLGGYKFPDGTVQTTAALSSIFHDVTLTGNGTTGSPLGIATGGVSAVHLATAAVISSKLANGTAVRSFNGLTDTVNLAAGANLTLTPIGNTLTIAAPGILSSVSHDPTLTGNGSTASLLGIATSGVSTVHLANNAVTAPKIANNTLVRSLNGLTDTLNLAAGANITITPAGGNTLTIAAAGILSSVTHDSTLTGNGTSGSPLGLDVPLTLNGSVVGPILSVINSNKGSIKAISTGTAIFGGSGTNAFPICAESAVCGSSLANRGVTGTSLDAFGVAGSSGNSFGVYGFSENSVGVYGKNDNFFSLSCPNSAICGTSFFNPGTIGLSNFGSGIFGQSSTGLAGEFNGDVSVTGTLSKGGGSFKIDHPLDPENKYLYHSFVESPEMKNIYDGNIVTNENGEAIVEMPEYFEALNRDFRYQLTVIGTFAQAIIAEEIKGNHFAIKTDGPNVKVSWQVTGVRQDAFANKHRIKVEVEKAEADRGFYLHPDAFNQPEERGIQFVKYPELVKSRKESPPQVKQKDQ